MLAKNSLFDRLACSASSFAMISFDSLSMSSDVRMLTSFSSLSLEVSRCIFTLLLACQMKNVNRPAINIKTIRMLKMMDRVVVYMASASCWSISVVKPISKWLSQTQAPKTVSPL